MRINLILCAVMIILLLTACSKQITAGTDKEVTAVTDTEGAGEPADVKLLEKAAPQSSALEICRFDGENTIRRIVFDETWKDKVISAVNSLKLTTADESTLSGWTEPCYGISMGDTDGMEIWLTYSNGLWIEKGGALYHGELDLASYFDEAASLDRTLEYTSESGISMPNSAVLAKHLIKYNKKATGQEVTEKDGVSLRFFSLDGCKVTVEYNNNTEKEYIYGDYYYLQKNIDGTWYQVPAALSNYAFKDIAHILNPGGNAKSTCDLTMYGELEAGRYRIVKENLYAEFDIGSDTIDEILGKDTDTGLDYFITETESVVPEVLPIPDSIGKVFCEGGKFLDVESGEYYTVTDYPYLDISAYDNEKHDHVVWGEYTVIDLNHDGINEVICSLNDEGVNSFYLILAVVENEVCAYRVTFRGMNPLLEDGRISGSSGADDNEFYCIVSFSHDGYIEKTLAKEDDGYYEIDGKPVTEEDWISYCKEFNSSEKAQWHSLSDFSNR